MDIDAVKIRAKEELHEEQFRAAVDAEKIRLREYRSLWVRIFPWKLTIIKRG